MLDRDLLSEMLSVGYVAEKLNGPYRLYNYTQKCQYERMWNDVTLKCRGLVLREDGSVQSRPFEKFFNVEEHDGEWLPDLPVEPFSVHEKLDGSLIVVSRDELRGGLLVTSRGAFDSVHARAAGEMLRGVEIPEGETWCMELLAPWNRIVVNYGDAEELVLLARLDNQTGCDIDLDGSEPFRHAPTLDDMTFEGVLERMERLGPDEEGYVLRFQSGVRAKAKGSEYKRLHRIITGTNEKSVWEVLRDGGDFSTLVENVPDEFHKWLSDVRTDLTDKYRQAEQQVRVVHSGVKYLPTRKDQAIAIKDFPLKSAVFMLLDGKDPSCVIWESVRPATCERPRADVVYE